MNHGFNRKIAYIRPFSGFALVYEPSGEKYLLKHDCPGVPFKATHIHEQRLVTPSTDEEQVLNFGKYPYNDLFSMLVVKHKEAVARILFRHYVDGDNVAKIRTAAAKKLEEMLFDAELRGLMMFWIDSPSFKNELRMQKIDLNRRSVSGYVAQLCNHAKENLTIKK
jgi:hypothetical protein